MKLQKENSSVINAGGQIGCENIKCSICDCNRLIIFARLPEYILLRCASCKSIIKVHQSDTHLSVELTAAPMDHLLDEYEAIYKPFRMQTYKRILDSIECYIAESISCLDVGCASGWFLGSAFRRGFKCYGIDMSGIAIQSAQLEVPSGRFEVGLFSENSFEGMQFDVISLLDVLEHMPDPMGALDLIHRRLRPHGLLVVRVPVIDSMVLCASKFTYTITRGTYAKPLNLLYRYHVVGFSSSSLHQSLFRSGFKILHSWRENSLDSELLSKKNWSKFILEIMFLRIILLIQNLQKQGDEIVVVARKLQ